MAKARETARIHLIAAKDAPVAVVIRRKPSRQYHIIRWNLRDDTFDHGSWFKGHLYAMRCDLSWNGELMSYLAMGNQGETWNGVCQLPWLTTLLESKNCGSYNGGGIFWKPDLLLINDPWTNEIKVKDGWKKGTRVDWLPTYRGEDLSIIFYRFARDDWKLRLGDWDIDMFDDEGFLLTDFQSLLKNPIVSRPKPDQPELCVQYVGYRGDGQGNRAARGPEYQGRTGYIFHFELEGFPDLLGPQVDWATWTNTGDLIWTRSGVVYRASMDALKDGREPRSFDFNDLERSRLLPGA